MSDTPREGHQQTMSHPSETDKEVMGPPPDYEERWTSTNHRTSTGPLLASAENPPAYNLAVSLPTYDESQQTKCKISTDVTDVEASADEDERMIRDEDMALLGNDFVFFTAFITSFLFNWVGFLLLMCFCHTIASRYGALAGFGLSLAKWTLIVQRSTNLVHEKNVWLCWITLAFGFLICARACLQYKQIKRSWPNLSSQARERLFFFY